MSNDLIIQQVDIQKLNPNPHNPRAWSEEAIAGLTESIKKYGLVDPLLANKAKGRENILISGHFRRKIALDLGMKTVPVIYLDIADAEKEKELALRLNKNLGEWSWELLAKFDESLLADVGFTSEELDQIFDLDDVNPEPWDLQKELAKLDINQIDIKKGDLFQIGDYRLLCGDSTVEADVQKLMGDEKADMVVTDPPYRLSYLKGGVRKGKPTTGFGAKRNRRYLETDELPPDFTEKWMKNVSLVARPDFSIIVFEIWRNLREIWGEIEKYWSVKNMIVWHLPNRNQGFAARYRLFSKHDVALVGASGTVPYNLEEEAEGLQETYETALYAIAGKPHWEGYKKGKRVQPTDYIEFNAADEKSSGQAIIFGVKPVEILLPYVKVLTRRGDLVLEPFMGSGSTMAAAVMLKRRCYGIEKSSTYAEVAIRRIEKLTGLKREKIG